MEKNQIAVIFLLKPFLPNNNFTRGFHPLPRRQPWLCPLTPIPSCVHWPRSQDMGGQLRLGHLIKFSLKFKEKLYCLQNNLQLYFLLPIHKRQHPWNSVANLTIIPAKSDNIPNPRRDFFHLPKATSVKSCIFVPLAIFLVLLTYFLVSMCYCLSHDITRSGCSSHCGSWSKNKLLCRCKVASCWQDWQVPQAAAAASENYI